MRLVIIFFLSSTYFFSQNPTKLIEAKNSLIQEITFKKTRVFKKQKKFSDELQALSTYIVKRKLKSTIIQQKDSIELYKKEIESKSRI